MIRVSPERMSSEDKESPLSSQINCFGGNPERTLDVHILYVSEISMSHQIKTCKRKVQSYGIIPTILLQVVFMFSH